MIRVVLPHHLRTLTGAGKELELTVTEPVTQRFVLDALEARYPVLRGTLRDRSTQQRRAVIRFFACGQDLFDVSPDASLPPPSWRGRSRT